MLGYTAAHNDIYFFFENDEIEQLEKGIIKGIYFNRNDLGITAIIKAVVKDVMHNITIIKTKNSDEGYIDLMYLQIWSKKYVELKENNRADIYDGFRQIRIRNAANIENLTFLEQFNFRQLKKYVSEIKKS